MNLYTVTAIFSGDYTTEFEAENEGQAIRFMKEELAEFMPSDLIACMNNPEIEIEDCEEIEDWED